MESDAVKIEPRQSIQFPVVYNARISKIESARITFRNKKDGGVQAAALVFDLKSNVVGWESREKREVNGVNLYEMSTVEIPINNPFEQDAEFIIKIEHIEPESHDLKIKKEAKAYQFQISAQF